MEKEAGKSINKLIILNGQNTKLYFDHYIGIWDERKLEQTIY